MESKSVKQTETINNETDVSELAPRILNRIFLKRTLKTDYVSGGNALEYDTMIEFEWQGKRYRLGVYEV